MLLYDGFQLLDSLHKTQSGRSEETQDVPAIGSALLSKLLPIYSILYVPASGLTAWGTWRKCLRSWLQEAGSDTMGVTADC